MRRPPFPSSHFLEGISKRYPEIGDRPKKLLSNPPEGSIEPLQGFYRTPFGAPKRFYRTLVRGTSEPQTGFCRTFRIEPPFLGYPFKILPTSNVPDYGARKLEWHTRESASYETYKTRTEQQKSAKHMLPAQVMKSKE